MSGTAKNPADEQMHEGERALASAADLIAKAAAPELDEDFKDYDDAKAEEAEGDAEVTPETSGEPPPTDEDFGTAPREDVASEGEGDDEDEDEDEEDEDAEAAGEPIMKAADPLSEGDAALTVDALPILQAIDDRLAAFTERLDRLDARSAATLGIAKAQQSALGHFAKAQDNLAGAPRPPKSREVVATSAAKASKAPDIHVLYAKAAEVVTAPDQFGMVEHFYNRKDPDGMLGVLTPEQRVKVLA